MHWYVRGLSCKPNIYVSWSTSELRVRLALLNRFKPSSKIFYWPFQGGTSFVDLLCFCSVLCLLCLCACLFICALWSPAGKGLTSWLSFVMSSVSLSLSQWYPGSDVVLDCIDSWSLHPYLHWNNAFYHFFHWERCAVDYTHNNCELICLIALHSLGSSKFILFSLLRLYYFNLLYGTLSLS